MSYVENPGWMLQRSCPLLWLSLSSHCSFSVTELLMFHSSCNVAYVRVQSINPALISAFHSPSSVTSLHPSITVAERENTWKWKHHLLQTHLAFCSSNSWVLFSLFMKRWEKNESTQVKVHPCSYCMRWFLSKMTVWNTWPTKMNSWPVPSDSSK